MNIYRPSCILLFSKIISIPIQGQGYRKIANLQEETTNKHGNLSEQTTQKMTKIYSGHQKRLQISGVTLIIPSQDVQGRIVYVLYKHRTISW